MKWAWLTIDRAAITLVLVVLLAPTALGQQGKAVRIRGYVVATASPGEFTVDDYRIDKDQQYSVSLRRPSDAPDLAVRVGAELQLDGMFDETSGQFRATAARRLPVTEDTTPPTTTITSAVPIEGREKSVVGSLRIEVREPNFDRRRSGRVTIMQNTNYEIIAHADIQRYIADLGWRLVPAFQRDLLENDPAKIPFKFFVAKLGDTGATALPNGVVIVFSETFDVVRNESQLASVVGHEIAHVVQKHMWKLSSMPESAIKTGYRRAFENQADRQALSLMLAAGYDPREAAATWRLMARKLGFSPLRGSHENYAVRRAFMMHELDTAYGDKDFRELLIEESRFKEIAGRVKKPY
jgi:hypothetical protein